MIINGASRRSVSFWVKHLQNDKTNARAELKEIRGLGAGNLQDALLEMQSDATYTQCQNFMYQANFSPTAEEVLSEEQWDRAFEIFEKHRGIPEGQARVVYEHEKEGRIHRHVVWSRIDLDKMKAWPDALDAKICHAASKEISEELGLHRSISPFDKDREGDRPERQPKSWEMFRGQKSGLDPRDIKAEVTSVFRESMNAPDFIAGLQAHGYQLVQGDRRNFCILDSAGDIHSLARRLEGVNSKDLKAFMSGIDAGLLPTVDQAKRGHNAIKLAEYRDDLVSIGKEIAWEDALAQAAIEKEKIEARFAEPTPAEEKEQGRREKVWPIRPPTSEMTKTSPEYHFGDAARSADRDKRSKTEPEGLGWIDKRVWQGLNQHEIVNPLEQEILVRENDPSRFRDRLRESELLLARVTKDEADQSHRRAEFAKATDDHAPRYKEGEIVAVSVYGSVRRLTQRNTGRSEWAMRTFFKGMDPSSIEGLEKTKALQAEQLEKPIATDRQLQVQGYREILRDIRNQERMEAATRRYPKEGIYRRDVKNVLHKGDSILRTASTIGNVAAKGTGSVLNVADKLIDALTSAFSPVLTPEQKAEARVSELQREAQADESQEISRFTASRAQNREEEETERSRDRGRERDR